MLRAMLLAPLDDPRYEPKYPPVNGGVPHVVSMWGPRSQLRWFRRFRDQLDARWVDWARYYCISLEHRGGCCVSCLDDEMEGYGGYGSGCCCLATG